MNAKIKLNTTVYTLSLPSPIYSSPQQICGMLKMKCSMLECSSMQSMKSNSQSAVSVTRAMTEQCIVQKTFYTTYKYCLKCPNIEICMLNVNVG